MSNQKLRGRRRALGPVVPSSGQRPSQEPGRRTAKRKGPMRQIADLAVASGVIHKGGLALAAGGLALTVAFPAQSGPLASSVAEARTESSAQLIAAPSTTEPLTAAAGAKISFTRTSGSSQQDPDARLKALMSASSGKVAPTASKGVLGPPLASVVQASPFGWRINPLGGPSDFHRGEDLVAQCGTSVAASAAGKVVFAGWHPYGGGNRVEIDHGNGLKTTYNHLSSSSVQVGQSVTRGEAIALSGTTGASTGCHLHFEVMVNNDVVDPVGWL